MKHSITDDSAENLCSLQKFSIFKRMEMIIELNVMWFYFIPTTLKIVYQRNKTLFNRNCKFAWISAVY